MAVIIIIGGGGKAAIQRAVDLSARMTAEEVHALQFLINMVEHAINHKCNEVEAR